MQNWKVTLAYDGTAYFGWQVQPGLATIQGELHAALQRIFGRGAGDLALPQGSGRTDSGVHALGQVASFILPYDVPAENILRALNRTLPAALRVLAAEPVSMDFHARHSARAKIYEYRIFRGRICPPFLAPYVHSCAWTLDLALLNQAASDVVGEHDFTSMAATEPDKAARLEESGNQTNRRSFPVTSPLRTIYLSGWTVLADSPATPIDFGMGEPPGATLIYRVRGNGFLHHMVRNLVGTMLEIARGQFAAGSMPAILAARSRSAAGPTAPAKGLFLHSVEYPSG